MAARYKRAHLELSREKIRVSQLINLLQDNALGLKKLEDGQRKSIEILLRKALPDLSAVEMQVDTAQPFAVLPAVMDKPGAWEDAFSPTKPETEH